MTRLVRNLAALALIALASTAWGQAQGSGQRGSVSRGDASFLRKAGEHGLAEVELGRLAQERGMREEVKQFGARMVADHGKANEELARIASARGVEVPAAPDKKHQRDRDKLSKYTGPEFDREFMKHMVADHRKDVREFARMAKGAKDAEVKEFAARQLPVLKSHLQAAQATYDLSRGSDRTGKRETGSTRP
jgi:putative membrane protein